MSKQKFPIPLEIESTVANYIVDAALTKIEKITAELEQCLAHMMTTLQAAEIAITGFSAVTDRMANDAHLLSLTVTSLSSAGDGKPETDSASISSIEFSVLMNEIAELRAQLASLERGKA